MTGLTGTVRLVRLALRRDRVALSLWIAGLTAFLGTTTAMFVNSLVTPADAAQEAALPTNNPGLRMLGLTSGPTIGGAVMVRDLVVLSILVAFMSALTVVRHTRQNEELGRSELVGAAEVGRYAGLAAGVTVAVAANVVLAVLLGLSMIVNSQPVPGSLTAGAAIAGVGLAFTGIAAVTCQLASTTRGAISQTGAAIGVAFLLSGVGNMLGTPDPEELRVTSAWPAWLSPIGWAQQMRPFGGDHPWPLGLSVLTFVSSLAVAVLLVDRRDVGRGVWAERRGHAEASTALLSSPGLVFRLQRGALVGWVAGVLGFGLIFGSMSAQIQNVHGSAREYYLRLGGTGEILAAYYTSMLQMAGMVVAIYAVQMLLRLRADEAEGTLESLLATGVSRTGWVAGHVLNVAGAAVLLTVLFAMSMGVTAGQAVGGVSDQVLELTSAVLVQLAGIAALGAAVIAVVGLLPRWSAPLSWALLILALAVGPLFGPALELPAWVQNLSPFTHVPTAPASEVAAAPVIWLALASLVLAAIGTVAIRRRSLVLPV